MTYDTVIIGGGPAGVAAAVYSARKQLVGALVTPEFGGQSVVSDDIQNWIGTPHISGAELASSLKNHVKEYEGEYLHIHEGARVSAISKHEDHFSVSLDNGTILETKSVLITAGSARRKLDVPGADRLEHKGLTYCASCDGPLFSGGDVAVIGGGNAAFESALQLSAYCKTVYLIHRSESFRADEITVEKIKQVPNIILITNAEMRSIEGDAFVEGLTFADKRSGEEKKLDVTGIFIEIGQIANTTFVGDLVKKDEYGKIVIDPWTGRTSVEGIWAAGDITNIRYHQNNIAAGDGVKAIEDLYQWVK